MTYSSPTISKSEVKHRNKLSLNRADIYIGIYILYQLQDIIYPAGLINQILLLIFFIISLLIGFKFIFPFKNKSFFLIATSLLLWMFIIYGIAFIIAPNQYDAKSTPNYFYLLNSLISLLPIFVFYDFFKKRVISKKRLRYYLFLLIVLYILHFFRLQNYSIIQSAEEGIFNEEFTNNTGYSFLSLLPLTLLLKNKIVRYCCIIILVIFIFSTFKRGAILITSIVLLVIVFNELRNSKNIKNLISSVFLVIIASFLIADYVYDKYETSDYFRQRLESTEEGNSSNRDIIYEDVAQSYLNGNFFQVLIGRGADSTFEAANNYAHQDWLETLHNNGILGAFLLFLFYLSIFLGIRKLKNKVPSRVLISFWVLFIICFLKSFFSMSIQGMEIGISMMLGYLAFLIDKTRKQTQLNSIDYQENEIIVTD